MTAPSPRTPWQETVLRPPPWTLLLVAARWFVRYGRGKAVKQLLLREWLDVGLRQNPRPPRIARTTFGFRFLSETTFDLIPRMAYATGCWEPCVSAFIAARLRPGDVFVDIGANIGWHSTLAARIVGRTGMVVAVEPTASLCGQLRRNAALNGCANVRVVQAAVTVSPGEVTLYVPHRGNIGATTTIRPVSHEAEFTVSGLPLADVVQPDELHRARVIKIDVEGAEGMVLAGLAPLLPQLRLECEIVVEVNPDRLRTAGQTVEQALKPFLDSGFHPYRLVNSYMPEDYPTMLESPCLPTRITEPITDQTDIVLSRVDAGALQ